MSDGDSAISERNWMSAIQAVLLVRSLAQEDEDAISILIRWAATGVVSTRYLLRRFWEEDDDEKFDEHDGFVIDDFWHRFYDRGQGAGSNWNDGYFLIRYFQSPTYHNVALYGVDFDSDELQRAVALQASARPIAAVPALSAATEPSQRASAKHPGGPKRKPYWDDLWIEVIRRVRAGALHTDKATELEAILDDIVEDLGYPRPGDSTLKPMSLKLFKYLREPGG